MDKLDLIEQFFCQLDSLSGLIVILLRTAFFKDTLIKMVYLIIHELSSNVEVYLN